MRSRSTLIAASFLFAWTGAAALAQPVDAAAAEALVNKRGCLACHGVSQKKDGPSFKEVGARYKGKADAEQVLFTHLTTNMPIKLSGKDAKHVSITGPSEPEIRNLVKWILSR